MPPSLRALRTGRAATGWPTSVMTETWIGGRPRTSRVGMERQDREHFSPGRPASSNLHWISANIKRPHTGQQHPARRTLGRYRGWLRSALSLPQAGSRRQTATKTGNTDAGLCTGHGAPSERGHHHHVAPHPDVTGRPRQTSLRTGQDVGASDSERPLPLGY